MAWDQYETVSVEELKGHAFARIDVDEDDRSVTFYGMKDQPLFRMEHIQDCCESVYLAEVIGTWDDLIGTPIFAAECVSNHADPRANLSEDDDAYWQVPDSETWTFYKFSTIKGSVTLRWYGTSNGYYSEGVSIIPWSENEDEEN